MDQQLHPVIRGAESFLLEGNSIGVLLCHGFLGTPQSMSELGHAIAVHGYTVSCPRLPGHGTHFKDLERFSSSDWFARIEKAYMELKESCSTIFVIGQSMGGTLTLDLASRYCEIAGILLLNPAIDIPSFENYREESASGYVNEDKPDIKKADAIEITYSEAPVKAYHELLRYMDSVKPKLADIHCPVIAFQSMEDHVVPPGNTDYILSKVQSEAKQKFELQDSYHIASMDNDLEFIIEKSIGFMRDTVLVQEMVQVAHDK
ncbi:alpha/beta fold hydrolase [Planococcus sp. APC 3906]|uniref:alpha/beta hydrolase n=1 Tax=Planococcus sp. APC 3906 TaxID=3035194 RepID=UPI0025B4A9E4|nr:alpha/beta fold hydrolase [Planococcus sp. APC 3906]MDN3450082.1 alpha/beta fold hydrolase [Planococcus sp. APC 3906]